MNLRIPLTTFICSTTLAAAGGQDILPFPPAPSGSQAGVAIQSSTYKKHVEPKRLPADAPNILIILIDTPRAESMDSWDSIPESEMPFQRRLMEIFAGFTEHADYNAGRSIDERDAQGRLENTLVIYIWGDNGSSSEGLYGTISEQLRVNGADVAQNRIPAGMSLHFTSNAMSDIGRDRDSPVSLDYFEDAPFAFNGAIGKTKITYLKN